jgi:hypothetical protein
MTNKDVQEAANTIIRYCREYSKEKSACVDCVVKDFCNGVAARKAPSELLTYIDDDVMKTRKIEALSNLADALRQGETDVAFTLLTANVVLIMKAPGFKRIVTVSDDINTMLMEVLQTVNDWK